MIQDAAKTYQQAVLYDLWHYYGVGEKPSIDFEPITAVLDSNETVLPDAPIRKPLNIFWHMAQSGEQLEEKRVGAQQPVGETLAEKSVIELANKWIHLDDSIDILLQTAEKDFSSLAMPFESGDISLYEHSRILAALACAGGKYYLLYAVDVSGIQNFLYTIGNKGALKGLKTRSFYLNILLAHTADTILESCGFTRLNLIYCGGGKAYMLLACSEEILNKADQVIIQSNQFLQSRFGTTLYLARGYAQASLQSLSSWQGDTPCFSDLFRKASAMISEKKLKRYTAEELISFNNQKEDHDRECSVCGNSSHLQERDGEYRCESCLQFERFATVLTRTNLSFVVDASPSEPFLSLPGGLGLCLEAQNPIRFYNVNPAAVKKGYPLYVGNYQPQSEEPLTFEMLGKASTGINNTGILRMDVDNLGHIFASGFVDEKSDKPYKRTSLIRYSALSSAMTKFFQNTINKIVASSQAAPALSNSAAAERSVSIVYSGGDDLFLAGAWNEVLDAALAIRDAFRKFSLNKASISGGMGLFGVTFPIRQMAAYCADLEDQAKQVPGKDAICLYDTNYVFPWSVYKEVILGEMLPAIENLCARESKGNTFIYHILTLLRSISNDPIAIARLAYLLARHKPRGDSGNYDAISRSLYKWALSPDENIRLQTAIQTYIYLHREVQEQ